MPHPPDFHKDDEARSRCYGCSHPELLEPTDDDVEYVKKLIAEGYHSCSNKGRHVGIVLTNEGNPLPPFERTITVSPEMPDWFVEKLRDWYENNRRNGGWVRMHGQKLTLSAAQYIAFKRAGGRTSY